MGAGRSLITARPTPRSDALMVWVQGWSSASVEADRSAPMAPRATRADTGPTTLRGVVENPGLEHRFDVAMTNIYDEAARLGYRPTRFLEMVSEHGGVDTAHRLLAADKIQDGLAQLFLLGRLDLTVEHHVLLPEYRSLFTAEDRRVARLRLGIAEPTEGDR